MPPGDPPRLRPWSALQRMCANLIHVHGSQQGAALAHPVAWLGIHSLACRLALATAAAPGATHGVRVMLLRVVTVRPV